MPAWEPACRLRACGPQWPTVEQPQPRWGRSAAMVRRTLGQSVAVFPPSPSYLLHTTNIKPFENKVWEIYFYKEVCSFVHWSYCWLYFRIYLYMYTYSCIVAMQQKFNCISLSRLFVVSENIQSLYAIYFLKRHNWFKWFYINTQHFLLNLEGSYSIWYKIILTSNTELYSYLSNYGTYKTIAWLLDYSLLLWHINHCRLLNAKSSLYIIIYDLVWLDFIAYQSLEVI